MPAVLPPTSAFTYCAEFKVDGVERVRFKDPVITYVDNFLGFDVGKIVPVRYYDRDRGVWVPSENGEWSSFWIETSTGSSMRWILTEMAIRYHLNANGDFADEVKGLNDPAKYQPNKTFWRMRLNHFSPWDFNLALCALR